MKDPLSRWEEKARAREHPLTLRHMAGVIFHYSMILLGLALIFAICGALLALQLYQRFYDQMESTPGSGWLAFCSGGTVGVAIILYFYFRKKRHAI